MRSTFFRIALDCGCGGNGSWAPADDGASLAPAAAPSGVFGPAAGGYFSTWAGDQPAAEDDADVAAEPAAS